MKNEKENTRNGQKFPMLGTSGMKGIGKSEFLLQVANHLVPDISRQERKAIHPMLLSFNGGGETKNIFMQEYRQTPAASDVLARVLHAVCRVDWPSPVLDTAKSESLLRQTINLIRSACQAEVLVLLVDEIGALEGGVGNECMSALMSCCDALDGKLVCLFCHIDQTILQKEESGSGRQVIPMPLISLPINLWREAKICSDADPRSLVEYAKRSNGLTHLLLSLSGHPRALFEGFEAALKKYPELPKTTTTSHFTSARDEILNVCKLTQTVQDDFVSGQIPKWLRRESSDAERQQLINAGLLHQIPMKDGQPLDLLFPLQIQAWSQTHAPNLALAYHLWEMYGSDAGLGPSSEKAMGVMMHFESALRLAFGDEKEFNLVEYYQVEPKVERLQPRRFKLKIPSKKVSNIKEVNSFNDDSMKDVVLPHLDSGRIVTSAKLTEKGLEYFAPFFDAATGTLVIACVQCKFVQEGIDWKKAGEMMEGAMKYFRDHGIEHFPVYFTTVDQRSTQKGTLDDSVLLLEEDIFKMTHRLGILRLHCMKLGKHLKKKYPFLSP